MDQRTPGHLVRERLQRKKLKERAGKRAWDFEKRLEEEKESDGEDVEENEGQVERGESGNELGGGEEKIFLG